MATKKEAEETKIESKFTKAQMLSSKKYTDAKDLLNILLENDKQYSFSEVEVLIDNFMKRKVM